MINRSNLSNIMKCKFQVIGIGVSSAIITYLVAVAGVLPFV
jgi:hypothetical protein